MKLALGFILLLLIGVIVFILPRTGLSGASLLWIVITLGWVVYFFAKKRTRN